MLALFDAIGDGQCIWWATTGVRCSPGVSPHSTRPQGGDAEPPCRFRIRRHTAGRCSRGQVLRSWFGAVPAAEDSGVVPHQVPSESPKARARIGCRPNTPTGSIPTSRRVRGPHRCAQLVSGDAVLVSHRHAFPARSAIPTTHYGRRRLRPQPRRRQHHRPLGAGLNSTHHHRRQPLAPRDPPAGSPTPSSTGLAAIPVATPCAERSLDLSRPSLLRRFGLRDQDVLHQPDNPKPHNQSAGKPSTSATGSKWPSTNPKDNP